MKNPIPTAARNKIYLACILLAGVTINVPPVVLAIQSGDWATAASTVSATFMLVGGIVAKQNLTDDATEAE